MVMKVMSEAAGIELSVKEEILPEEFALNQTILIRSTPTQIRYALAENSNVTITIYNMLGNKVRTLVNERQDAGFRNVYEMQQMIMVLWWLQECIYIQYRQGNFIKQRK